LIDIIDLTVVYPDGTKALDNINLSAKKGERIAIIGVNGAGKSTLLLSIVGVVPISTGSIGVDSCNVTKKTLPEIRKMVGMVFQNPDDQLFMTKVYDDVAFAPRNYGMTEGEVASRVESSLESLGITHLKERAPHRLSGGEKRRVAIAGVLAMEPSVILLDEPTSFLDPRSRKMLIETLAELPHTQIIATHDLDMVQELCQRVIVLKDGVIQADDTAEIVLADKKMLEELAII
jgi:cobalt/nickel transport system ATP-binding protein